jgi:hypothetical protein
MTVVVTKAVMIAMALAVIALLAAKIVLKTVATVIQHHVKQMVIQLAMRQNLNLIVQKDQLATVHVALATAQRLTNLVTVAVATTLARLTVALAIA